MARDAEHVLGKMQTHKVTERNEPLTTEYCKAYLSDVAVHLQQSFQELPFLVRVLVRLLSNSDQLYVGCHVVLLVFWN